MIEAVQRAIGSKAFFREEAVVKWRQNQRRMKKGERRIEKSRAGSERSQGTPGDSRRLQGVPRGAHR